MIKKTKEKRDAGLILLGYVIIAGNIIIIWSLMPSLPGSFNIIALPMWLLRVLNSLASIPIPMRRSLTLNNFFIYYQISLSLTPIILAILLLKLNNISRKILVFISAVNALYWLWTPIAISIQPESTITLKSFFLEIIWHYAPALTVSLLFCIYLTDPRVRRMFMD